MAAIDESIDYTLRHLFFRATIARGVRCPRVYFVSVDSSRRHVTILPTVVVTLRFSLAWSALALDVSFSLSPSLAFMHHRRTHVWVSQRFLRLFWEVLCRCFILFLRKNIPRVNDFVYILSPFILLFLCFPESVYILYLINSEVLFWAFCFVPFFLFLGSVE